MRTKIYNPVLTGFNPDPCVLRVGKTYYLAVSTFEYYPGVQIYASDDLLNWTVIARPITSDKENMTGVPQGGGVWAPSLTYDGKLFYLVYSKLSVWSNGPYKDCENFLIAAEDPRGKWSDPVFINGDGFDASLFHDDDGKSYYMCMRWDYRKPDGAPRFDGILLWNFDAAKGKTQGEPVNIFKGTERGLVEGPHIYKKDGYYYLFTAEGGTNVEHAETVARSKDIFGPYELHPLVHILSSYKTDNPLQKAGHASITDDGKGNWYMFHLCGRKRVGGNCVLGRETAVQNIVFKEDGWPYLAYGGTAPQPYFTVPRAPKRTPERELILFDDYTVANVFQSLREPLGARLKIVNEHEIELRGGASVCSLTGQSLLCLRQSHFVFSVEFGLKFDPVSFNHIAGLIYRYNEENQYLFFMSFDEESGEKRLYLQRIKDGAYTLFDNFAEVDSEVVLKLDVDYDKACFSYSQGGVSTVFADGLETSFLSDEGARPMGFTGAFAGMYCGDFSRREKTAAFSDFYYRHGKE